MKNSARGAIPLIVALGLFTGAGVFAGTPPHASSPDAGSKEGVMTHHANGTFEVKLTPQAADDKAEGATVDRMSIVKRFHGGLDATSAGRMLAVMTATEGSAGYVAMEIVTGTLAGRKGSFALQHSGTMTRGAPQLSVTVVPDSGTDALAGIAGRMTIDIVDGQHLYDFTYTLPNTP